VSLEELLIIIAFFVAALCIAVFLLYKVMKVGRKKKKELLAEVVETKSKLPITKDHTVTIENAKKAQDELKTLDVEREIVSYAIRRLYEAHIEGKLSEQERDRLAGEYKERMESIKGAMSRNESVVALHELEAMQDDLIKLFNDRFDELGTKIENLRTRLDIKTIKEVPIPTEAESTEEEETTQRKEKKKEGKPQQAQKKTEAEERVEKIKEEVEQVLEKLGQIEAEG